MAAPPGKLALHKVACCASLLMLLAAACGRGTKELNGNGNPVVEGQTVGNSSDTLYYLDINKPSIRQALDPRTVGPGPYKFVQVEVAEVVNPKKHPLTFEVRYQSKSDVTAYLGSFSLYPSDNPGKFIVATQGKVKDDGAIILSFETPDKTDNRDTIRVTVKRLQLLRG
ncbi:MAG TPA: hypothetical protein VK747_21190 [Blastocatellia bacterium]|nr:hypothetical protein [Blastocatellia bacterium]